MSDRYGPEHRAVRAAWAPAVERGEVTCARCGHPIAPAAAWDLGHVDGGRPDEYQGPEHRRCNRGAGARTANRRRRRHPLPLSERW
ncbi:hypothetical protein GCM10023113_27700 [Cellulomonas oligotrophica]|uniref:HNH endonuclease n=1 Tax=Cellulomonas oligotrophica TaxID=931536 RepID=A0ABQ4DBA1_9CELL|nr:hypothetical protein Col01nite_21670 [Cellulomonas oligotrophica]